jgi:hypothetical protein
MPFNPSYKEDLLTAQVEEKPKFNLNYKKDLNKPLFDTSYKDKIITSSSISDLDKQQILKWYETNLLNTNNPLVKQSAKDLYDKMLQGDDEAFNLAKVGMNTEAFKNIQSGKFVQPEPIVTDIASMASDLAAFGTGTKVGKIAADALKLSPIGKYVAPMAGAAFLWANKRQIERFFRGKSTEPGILGGPPASTKSDLRLGAEDIVEGMAVGVAPASAMNLIKRSYPAIKAAAIEANGVLKKPSEWISEKVTDPFWDKVVQAANLKLLPTTEKMMVQNKEISIKVKKSLADIMQPAVERLDTAKQSVFRDTTALKLHLNKWGQDIGNVLARETDPLVKLEVSRGLRGTPLNELTTERAKDIVFQFSRKLSDLELKPKYENSFIESISTSIGKRLQEEEKVFLEGGFTDLLDPITKKVGLAKVKSFMDNIVPSRFRQPNQVEVLQKGLRDLIEDPSISRDYRTAAMDLHDLSATLPEEVAKSSIKLHNTIITDNLKRMPGVVLTDTPERVLKSLKDQVKQGLSQKNLKIVLDKISAIESNTYLPSTWQPFTKKGTSLYVQRDVELELKALQEIPKIANANFNKYFMGPWKMAKVMLRPAAWGRNGLTNLAQNHLGGLPFWRQDLYLKSYQGMRGSNQVKVEGTAVSKHWNNYSRITGAGGTFATDDVISLGQGMKYGSNMWERSLSTFDKITAPAKSIYSAQEQMFKFAKYLHNIEKGLNKKEAAWDAMKWTFNYGEVTRATAFTRSYVAPFFTWQSKVFPQVLEAVVKHPIKFTGLVMLYSQLQNLALEEAGMTPGEFETFKTRMPEYLQSGLMMPMPWRDQQGRLNFLDLTYIIPGFGDAYQMSGHPMAQIFQQPLVSIAAGLQSNKKYSGSPIYYDWEPSTTKVAKMFMYTWEQLMPAVVPGGTDWDNMYQAFITTPMSEFEPTMRDLSRLQAVSSSVGLKINPVDESSSIRNFEARRRISTSEMKIDLKKKLRDARSEKEKEELLLKYVDQIKDLNQND